MAIATSAAPASRNGHAVQPFLTIRFPQKPEFDQLFSVLELKGQEGLSQLYRFEVQLAAENRKTVPFADLMGQPVAVALTLANGQWRYFSGIINLFSKKNSDQTHTYYRADIVPRLWLLTKKFQSRVFQNVSTKQIIRSVLQSAFTMRGGDQILAGATDREYCVQYRESDFNFISRLAEEEGFYYFFEHRADGESIVFADAHLSKSGLYQIEGDPEVILDQTRGGNRDEGRVTSWEKTQEIRSGKYTVWDHSFQLPQSHLEADKTIQGALALGVPSNRLDNPYGQTLEIYDYPGGYAKRYDGINRGGGEQPEELQSIFQDNKQTATTRIRQEAGDSVRIHGTSTYAFFRSALHFDLLVDDPSRPGRRKSDGEYALTQVRHHARQPLERSGDGAHFSYDNEFDGISGELNFAPPRRTPRPIIAGTQTAVVVGPKDSEVYTDKYGRIKVQFFWDREGKKDLNSSCWIRVAQIWAGTRWGAHFWPRVGQEVIVAFEEGDPDQPIVVGSVYNADNMPSYLGNGLDPKHPNDPKVSGIKTCTTPGGDGFNEIRFDDTKGKEQVFIRSQKALDVRALGSQRTSVGGDCHATVCGDAKEKIGKNKVTEVGESETAYVAQDYQLSVGGKAWFEAFKGDASSALLVLGDDVLIAEAEKAVILNCGESHIALTPQGIWLWGPQVLINSGKPEVQWNGGRPDDLRGTAPADDSKSGFVSNPDAAKKSPPAAGSDRTPGGRSGD